jgi:hypothetical protein
MSKLREKMFSCLNTPFRLLISIILVNVVVMVACPSLSVPPPLSTQHGKAIAAAAVSSLPLFWTFLLIVFGRGRLFLLFALMNLLPAVCWILFALRNLTSAFA